MKIEALAARASGYLLRRPSRSTEKMSCTSPVRVKFMPGKFRQEP